MQERRPDKPAHLSDDVVDAFFDRSLEEASRDRFYASLRTDLKRCEQVARTQRALSMLRGPVECPDFTDDIMHRVNQRRAFLPPALRKMVTGGRTLVAASVLMGLLGVVAIHRYAPDAARLAPEPRPVSALVESGCDSAAASAQQLAGSLNAVRAEAASLAAIGQNAVSRVENPAAPLGKSSGMMAHLTPGSLTSVRVLSADSFGTALTIRGGSESIDSPRRFVLAASPMDRLPTPRTTQWVWAAGPGRTLQESLFLLPDAADSSANPLWPAIDPLLVNLRPQLPRQ